MQKIYKSRQPCYNIWGRYLLFLFLPAFFLTSCKKDKDPDPEEEEIISPTTGTRTQFTLDSIFLYARHVYLWQDALPTYQDFDPRVRYGNISPEFTAYKKELFDITQYKKTVQVFRLKIRSGQVFPNIPILKKEQADPDLLLLSQRLHLLYSIRKPGRRGIKV